MKTTSPQGETGAFTPMAAMSEVPADHYRMLGVDFCLQTDNQEVREFFRAAYRRFASLRPEVAPALRLVALLAPPRGGPFAAAGARRLDLSGRPMPVNRAFLFLLNALMDEISDYLVIHGAAISVAGRGIILAGPPTAGKSTLVLELARRGATFLSDDVAPVNRATGQLHPFPRAVGIRREGESMARFDPATMPAGSVHELAYKWLVDPAALGLRLPDPQDAGCPVSAVVLLDTGQSAGAAGRTAARRTFEIALAEPDQDLLEELSATPGVADLHEDDPRPFPVFTFTVEAASRPMATLAEICRRRRDLVLYMDESRNTHADRPDEPELREARGSSVLMELTRDLLNRSETGKLMASCGGLPALVSEMGRLLEGARTFRLQPGQPGKTAEMILAMAARAE